MTPTANAVFLEHFDHLLETPEAVERLNQAILDLAVRGKLVPQDPTDEPASELLKRTKTGKAKLIGQGEFANSALMPVIRESERPFALPKGWIWARFGDITINRDGERIPVAKEDRESRQGEYDYYGASGVIDKVDSYLFDKSLLLIGEDGANLVNRSTPIAFIAHGKYWVNNHAHVLDAIDFAVLKYLEVYINAIDLKPYLTGTAQPKMNQAKMNSIVVAVPPLVEQQRIVARVEQLFAQTRQLAALLSKAQTGLTNLNAATLHHLLAADTPEDFNARWDFIAEHFDLLYSEPEHIAPLRQAILELAVRGKLTRQDAGDEPASELLKRIQAEKARLVEAGEIRDRDSLPAIKESERPFDLPGKWAWARLGQIIELISGQHILTHEYNSEGDGTPYLTGPADFGIINPVISKWSTKPKVVASAGDILITVKGAGLGKLNIVNEGPIAIGRQLMAIRAIIDVNATFLYYFLRSKFQLFQSSGVGIAIPGLSREDINGMPLPLPPLAEQQRIVARVEQLLGLCDALEAQLQAAQTQREKLVGAVVAGVAAG